MNRSQIKLVCFDLGGVLVRLSKDWIDACTRAGVKIGADDQRRWVEHQVLLAQLERGEFGEDVYERRVIECLPGVELPHVLAAFDAWLVGIYPRVGELIAELKSRGVQMGILSNTNPRHWRTILKDDPQYAALEAIQHPFASHLLKVSKPDARAYRAVEIATGIDGGSILFFDDAEANVAGARQAGWNAERITDADTAAQMRQFLKTYRLL